MNNLKQIKQNIIRWDLYKFIFENEKPVKYYYRKFINVKKEKYLFFKKLSDNKNGKIEINLLFHKNYFV